MFLSPPVHLRMNQKKCSRISIFFRSRFCCFDAIDNCLDTVKDSSCSAYYHRQHHVLELLRNLMAHAQKPDFVFRLNGRVHLNRRGSQFSRLLAAEVCASALVMLDTPRSEVVWEYWLHTPLASFHFTSSPVRHRLPPHSERSILHFWSNVGCDCKSRSKILFL